MIGVDLDGDGDRDVLSSGIGSGGGWQENLDGPGTFGSRQLIPEYGTLNVLSSAPHAIEAL